MRTRLLVLSILLTSTAAQAQWWPLFAPQDYEDCVAQVEKSDATKEARAARIAECDGKFAGRRKPGGGYTYYDFMQDRHFDIAGPNPTPEELKKFDQEYTGYLERRRHDAIVAALSDKQRQDGTETAPPRIPAPRIATTGSIAAPRAPATPRHIRPNHPTRVATPQCQGRLSCTWTGLSDGVRGWFGAPPKARPPARI
jgi:hypothetical protein